MHTVLLMQFTLVWYRVTLLIIRLLYYKIAPNVMFYHVYIEGRKCWCNGLWTSTLVQGNVDCDMKYTREKSHKKAFSGTLNFLLNVLQKHLIFATLGRSMQSCIRKVKWPIISAICDFFGLKYSGTKRSIEYTAVCW